MNLPLGQDCRERTMLLRLMRKLNAQGLGIIMVTHDMDILAEHADKVIVINQGELAFDGTPLDLFSQKELTLKLGFRITRSCLYQPRIRSRYLPYSYGNFTLIYTNEVDYNV